MTLSIPMKRGLVFLPVILLAALFALDQLQAPFNPYVLAPSIEEFGQNAPAYE